MDSHLHPSTENEGVSPREGSSSQNPIHENRPNITQPTKLSDIHPVQNELTKNFNVIDKHFQSDQQKDDRQLNFCFSSQEAFNQSRGSANNRSSELHSTRNQSSNDLIQKDHFSVIYNNVPSYQNSARNHFYGSDNSLFPQNYPNSSFQTNSNSIQPTENEHLSNQKKVFVNQQFFSQTTPPGSQFFSQANRLPINFEQTHQPAPFLQNKTVTSQPISFFSQNSSQNKQLPQQFIFRQDHQNYSSQNSPFPETHFQQNPTQSFKISSNNHPDFGSDQIDSSNVHAYNKYLLNENITNISSQPFVKTNYLAHQNEQNKFLTTQNELNDSFISLNTDELGEETIPRSHISNTNPVRQFQKQEMLPTSKIFTNEEVNYSQMTRQNTGNNELSHQKMIPTNLETRLPEKNDHPHHFNSEVTANAQQMTHTGDLKTKVSRLANYETETLKKEFSESQQNFGNQIPSNPNENMNRTILSSGSNYCQNYHIENNQNADFLRNKQANIQNNDFSFLQGTKDALYKESSFVNSTQEKEYWQDNHLSIGNLGNNTNSRTHNHFETIESTELLNNQHGNSLESVLQNTSYNPHESRVDFSDRASIPANQLRMELSQKEIQNVESFKENMCQSVTLEQTEDVRNFNIDNPILMDEKIQIRNNSWNHEYQTHLFQNIDQNPNDKEIQHQFVELGYKRLQPQNTSTIDKYSCNEAYQESTITQLKRNEFGNEYNDLIQTSADNLETKPNSEDLTRINQQISNHEFENKAISETKRLLDQNYMGQNTNLQNPNVSQVGQNYSGNNNYFYQSNVRSNEQNETKRINYPTPLEFDSSKIYHILKTHENQENNISLDKYSIWEPALIRFSEILSDDQSKQLIKVDHLEGIVIQFEKLKEMNAKFIGIFGRSEIVLDALVDYNFIRNSDKTNFDNYLNNNGSGLYLLPLNKDKANLSILIILFSNDQNDFDHVTHESDYPRLLRYLTQLCNVNIIAFSEKDEELINFKTNEGVARHTRFVHKTNQTKEEKFEIEEGQNLNIFFKNVVLFGDDSQIGFYLKNQNEKKIKTQKRDQEIDSKEDFERIFKDYSVEIQNIERFSSEIVKNFVEVVYQKDTHQTKTFIKNRIQAKIVEEKEQIYLKSSSEVDSFKRNLTDYIKIKSFPRSFFKLKELNPEIDISDKDDSTFFDKKNLEKYETIQKFIVKSLKNWDNKLLRMEKHALIELFQKNDLKKYDWVFSKGQTKKHCFDLIQKNLNSSYWIFFDKLGSNYKINRFIKEKMKEDLFISNYEEDFILDSRDIFEMISPLLENHKEYLTIKNDIQKNVHNSLSKEIGNKVYLEIFQSIFEKQNGKQPAIITDIYYLKSSFNKFKLEFETETITESSVDFKIHKIVADKKDIEKTKIQQNYVLVPKYEEIATINVKETDEVLKIFFFKENHIGIIINKNQGSEISFYDISQKKIIEGSKKDFGKTILICDYNPNFKQIVYFSKYDHEVNLVIYQISETMLSKQTGLVNLRERFSIDDVKFLKTFSANTVILVDRFNKIHLIDHRNSAKKTLSIQFDDIKKLLLLPKTNCLVLINQKKIQPVIIESKNKLAEIENTFNLNPKNCEIGVFENQIQLIYSDDIEVKSKLLKCTLNVNVNSLCSVDPKKESSDKHSKKSGNLFDNFNYLYHKFSINSPMDSSENQNISQKLIIYVKHHAFRNQEFELKIRKKLKEIQENIKKPNAQMIGLESNAVFVYSNQNQYFDCVSFSKPRNLGRWIQDLICFVPIKIARANNNLFTILSKGEQIQTNDFKNVFQLQKQISFGLSETILNNWNKDIKVITSMGKQSTGKSYTLNHLSGASFGISAARCTDGCWFTMKISEDCLYILMDFEGLGSFERSEQEDMLLSVMNASLSNITLFKTEFSVSKETDQMFNRFNQGANLLKGNDNLFSGTFCIIMKDVRDIDVVSLTEEFKQKIETIIERENDKNFLTTMYKNGFDIFPFHSIEVPEYYQDMEALKNYIQDEISPIFKNGKDFLNLLKTIMAKMAIQDFTSLNKQDIENRVNLLRETYTNAIYFGNVSSKPTVQKDYVLKSYDQNDKKINEYIEIEVQDKSGTSIKVSYEDASVDIDQNSKRFIDILEQYHPLVHDNHVSWSQMYRDLKKKGIRKRIERVLEWINANLDKWSENVEFKDLVDSFKREISYKSKEIEALNGPCLMKCDECYVSCILPVNHIEKHLCSRSSHFCSKTCDYCEETMNEMVGKCNLQFGHPQKHRCADKPHTCELNCKYKKCQNSCVEPVNHEDDHLCSLVFHHCLEKCSLKDCLNLCQINSDIPHQVHKCVNEQCIKHCEVEGCSIKCGSDDHFHCDPVLSEQFKIENNIGESHDFIDDLGQEVELDFHCCGNVHSCNKNCESAGFCQVITELKVDNKEFKGKRDQFNFQRRYENIGNKLKCRVKIDRLAKDHPGNHIHSNDSSTAHICMTRCPTCNNICEKPEGHSGKHNTAHSNMVNTYFISNQNDVDVGGHKYTVGESSVAEMCHMFCKQLGRGHIHVIECGDEETKCVNNGNPGMRHETCKYGPNEDETKDEILHSEYWESIGFEDPCQEIDKEDFSKCPHYCASKEHENETEHRYCQLDIWHKKVSTLDEIHKTNGVVSVDGHYFECSHPDLNHGFLFILCLDDSESMSGQRWTDLSCAVNDFAITRRQTITDKLTIIQFNEKPVLKCRNIQFSQFDANIHLVFRKGGTNFGSAIEFSHKVLQEDYNQNLIPVFVFMSDGKCHNGEHEIEALATEFLPKDLKVFTISFGKDREKLRKLANISKGTYLKSMEGMELKRNFIEISSRFGTTISVLKSAL